MKTFTVRELDRSPGKVLDAADKDGAVQVKRRDGRIYAIRPISGESDRMRSLPDFAARRAAIFPQPIPEEQVRLADKMIAGE